MRQLSGQGFKILLDLLASSPRPMRLKELPYVFRRRQHGESKLDTMVAWEFACCLPTSSSATSCRCVSCCSRHRPARPRASTSLCCGRPQPRLGSAFTLSQSMATFVAMTSNFFLNNFFTYRDKRLRGGAAARACLFYLICGLGAVANVGIASYVFSQNRVWWLAGVAGAMIGVVWNFAMSSAFTWKRR